MIPTRGSKPVPWKRSAGNPETGRVGKGIPAVGTRGQTWEREQPDSALLWFLGSITFAPSPFSVVQQGARDLKAE